MNGFYLSPKPGQVAAHAVLSVLHHALGVGAQIGKQLRSASTPVVASGRLPRANRRCNFQPEDMAASVPWFRAFEAPFYD
jgi:hypothetical protein